MGPPDRCQHAAHVINELILTAQVSPALWSWDMSPAKADSATQVSGQHHRAVAPCRSHSGTQVSCRLPASGGTARGLSASALFLPSRFFGASFLLS